VEAFQQMATNDTKFALGGGVENMSQAPYLLKNARWGFRMGNQPITDLLTDSLYDNYAQAPMAITAENLAQSLHITREQADAFALRSQRLYKDALQANRFKDEITPVTLTDKKGNPTSF